MKSSILVLYSLITISFIARTQSLCFYDAIGSGPLQYTGGISGWGTYGIASADFNGDGISDIATANSVAGNISILLGNLTGIFSPPVNYTDSFTVSSIATFDLNNDGIADIVTSSQDASRIAAFIGYGDGTFYDAVYYTATGNGVYEFTHGDFNSDEFHDVATANDWSQNISVFINEGDGTFQAAVNYPMPTFTADIATGDFNSDQIPDLAVSNIWNYTFSILYGNGNGEFEPPMLLPTKFRSSNIVVTDFNSDSIDDIICTDFLDENIAIHLGYGDGTFQAEMDVSTDWYQPSEAIAIDFNEDGFKDLVAAAWNGNGFIYLLNTGNISFSPPGHFLSAVSPVELAIADLNQDGQLDVVIPSSNSPYFTAALRCTETGIENIQNVTVKVFPNPFYDRITIYINSTLLPQSMKFMLTDVAGRIILMQELTNGHSKIENVQTFNGIYFYKIFNGANIIKTGKLVGE